MKFLTPQFTYLIKQREWRENLSTLAKYLAFLGAVIALYSVLFHFIMLYEGQSHSWITGVYWTLTVMSTLGFGDITFQSDLGRAFSIVVLLSGIILLLIVLPFAFIRFFYAPWLEAQIKSRAPREAPDDCGDHVVVTKWDPVAEGLTLRLEDAGVAVFVLEEDPTVAARLHDNGVSVITGPITSKETYEATKLDRARALVANVNDPVNTNITITAREISTEVPVFAFAEELHSVDVLELSGATNVLPLKDRLGEQLAGRVTTGTTHVLRVGRFHDLQIAEFVVHGTPLAGRTVRETRLAELTGLNIIGVWDRGSVRPVTADVVLDEHSVAIVLGSEEQVTELEAMFSIYQPREDPVVVIGGGKVGQATMRALRERGAAVNVIELDEAYLPILSELGCGVFIGDASDLDVVEAAGVKKAPTVVLSTNDDAMNIFLSVYCRRLNPDTRIVSRITHERNLEAIHRAGADFALSPTTLAVRELTSLIMKRETFLLGEGADLFILPVPDGLVGKTLRETDIRAKTGLNVLALQNGEGNARSATPGTQLNAASHLLALGTAEQRHEFARVFGKS